MSGNRIEEGLVTPNPAAASTLSSRRNGDIKEHFFNSGFTAQGNNPDKEIYNLAEARFGAKWVSVVLGKEIEIFSYLFSSSIVKTVLLFLCVC